FIDRHYLALESLLLRPYLKPCQPPAPHLNRPRKAPMDSLFDQSSLTALADRLVQAAKKAGADAADAVAMRSVSLGVQVREGEAEESERAEGNDMGLRVLVGRRQAVVSTNDIAGGNVDELAARAVAMARAAPEDRYAGLAATDQLARLIPDL